jgi:hypothetical protein
MFAFAIGRGGYSMSSRRFLLGVVAICWLVSPAVWAGKPPAPPRGDTTPPATINDLTATPTTRAITLKFTATGDDGNSGTAKGYDIRYRVGDGANCSVGVASDPQLWTLAARSVETTAEAPGTVDYFNIRGPYGLASHGLAAGTSYCVAIRVLDEVPNPSGWARTQSEVQTLGAAGDWPLTAIPVALPGAVAQHTAGARVMVDPDSAQILAGWATVDFEGNTTTPGSLRFAVLPNDIGATDQIIGNCPPGSTSGCVETVPDAIWMKYFDTSTATTSPYVATFTHVPGPDADVAAFLVGGVKVGSRTSKNSSGVVGAIIVQRSASGVWSVVGENNDGQQPQNDPAFIPFQLDAMSYGWSNLAYAPDGAGGWNPVVVWRAVLADGRSYQKAVVYLSARTPSGWTNPVVLSTRETGGGLFASDLFLRRQVFNKPDGTLAVMIDGALNTFGKLVYSTYAERVASNNPDPATWQWRYYSIDPTRNRDSLISFDGTGKAIQAYSLYNTSEIRVFRGPDPAGVAGWSSPMLAPLPGFDYRTNGTLTSLNSWTLVYSDPVYDDEVPFRSVYAGGLAVDACNTAHISSAFFRSSGNGMGVTSEQRVIAAPTGAASSDERIDATDEEIPQQVLYMPNGDRVVAYTWSYIGGYAVSYTTRPPNFLYLARGGTGCAP